MNIVDVLELYRKYAKCPECGCDTVGDGTGTIEFDTTLGYFKRTCQCGWHVEISEDVKDA